MMGAPDYLNPNVPPGLTAASRMPVVDATPAALDGYGRARRFARRRRASRSSAGRRQGWRPVDPDSGDEGGTKEGTFVSEWKGDILYGRNEAVGGHYILGYADRPRRRRERAHRDRRPASSSGTPTTTPTAGSCSSRSTAARSSCRWPSPATT